jgi:hypothetical protein
MTTRFVIELDDMGDTAAGALGLWLDMMLRDETNHTVHKLSYQRDCQDAPNTLSDYLGLT